MSRARPPSSTSARTWTARSPSTRTRCARRPGEVTIELTNDAPIPHDVSVEGNGVRESSPTAIKPGGARGRARARHVHLLLLRGQPSRSGHGGHAHDRLAARGETHRSPPSRSPQVIASYLVEGAEPAIVDCACRPASRRWSGAGRQRLALQDVHHLVLTHIHLDHAGAAGVLVRKHPGLRVHVSGIGAPHLVDPSRLERSARRLYGEDFDFSGASSLQSPRRTST